MRLLISAIAGIAVALALFLMMSGLISGDSKARRDLNRNLNLDFIQLNLDEVENIRRRTPPPPPRRVAPLPTLPRLTLAPEDMNLEPMPRLDVPSFGIAEVQLNSPLEFGRFAGAFSLGDLSEDGDIVPVLLVEPTYPIAARIRRINGWVDLEYTVTAKGNVIDIVVIKSEPLSTFDDSAVTALANWRFKPRVVNGQPVPARVEQRIYFNVLNQ